MSIPSRVFRFSRRCRRIRMERASCAEEVIAVLPNLSRDSEGYNMARL